MKIYSKVVIDMNSLEVVETVAEEYDGLVAECKSTGASTTSSYDPAYNDRMATIAESQQDMAQGYYDFWMENNADYEKAKIDANMQLIPAQTDYQKAELSSAMGLLPAQTDAQKSGFELQTAQNQANLGLVGKQTELSSAKLDQALGLVPAQTEAAHQFYDAATKGVNIEDRMGKAGASVAHSYKDAGNQLARGLSRMGASPNSGQLVNAMTNLNMDKAKSTALAKEQARSNGENENYARLKDAMGFGLA